MHRNHKWLKPIHKKNRIIIFEAVSKAGGLFRVYLHGLGFCFHSTLETKHCSLFKNVNVLVHIDYV